MHDLSTQQAVFPATLHQKTTRPFFMATPNRTPSAPHPRPGMKTCRFGPCLAHCQIGPGPPGVQTAEVPAEAPLLQRLQRFRMGRTPVPAPRRRKYSMVVTIVLVWNWDNSRRNICIYIYIYGWTSLNCTLSLELPLVSCGHSKVSQPSSNALCLSFWSLKSSS